MGAAWSVVDDGDLSGCATERSGCESHLNGAVAARGRQQRTTIVCSGKIRFRLDACDEQSSTTRVDENHRLGIACAVESLIAEVELLRRDRNPGGVGRTDLGNEGVAVCARRYEPALQRAENHRKVQRSGTSGDIRVPARVNGDRLAEVRTASP